MPVRPFNHNEHDRYIIEGYPYYAGTFGTVTVFFIFFLFFLYDKDVKDVTEKEQ